MQAALAGTPNLEIREAGAEDSILANGRVAGVLISSREALQAGAVVLTTGTFLRGLIHCGERKIPAGRAVAGRSEFAGEGVNRLQLGFQTPCMGSVLLWAG